MSTGDPDLHSELTADEYIASIIREGGMKLGFENGDKIPQGYIVEPRITFWPAEPETDEGTVFCSKRLRDLLRAEIESCGGAEAASDDHYGRLPLRLLAVIEEWQAEARRSAA